MPPSKSLDEAVSIIDNGALDQIARKFPGSVVFEETDTLEHVPVGGRLLVCVFDKDGTNKTPVDETRKFHATDIVVGVNIDRAFVGPRTTCKEPSAASSKQTVYVKGMHSSARSDKFISEIMRVFNHEHYAKAVEKHPMHSAKQGSFMRGSDATKGIMALSRKNKLHTPVADDDMGNPESFVARRKVFSGRHAYKDTGTDFDTKDLRAFCEEQAPKSRTGNLCIDPVPIFFADGSKCVAYDEIRSSSAAIAVFSLRPDWVNAELGNISWPNSMSYLQMLTVGMARTDAAIEAPNFMGTAEEETEDAGIDFTAQSNKRDASTDEEGDEDDAVDSFVAKRRRTNGMEE